MTLAGLPRAGATSKLQITKRNTENDGLFENMGFT